MTNAERRQAIYDRAMEIAGKSGDFDKRDAVHALDVALRTLRTDHCVESVMADAFRKVARYKRDEGLFDSIEGAMLAVASELDPTED